MHVIFRIKDIEMKTHSRKKRNDIVSVHYDKGTSIKTQLSNNIKTGKFKHITYIYILSI